MHNEHEWTRHYYLEGAALSRAHRAAPAATPSITWQTVTLSDDRVAAELAERLIGAAGYFNKIRLDKNPRGKTWLRVFRASDGRYFVRCGYRGGGRSYLADRCEITTIDGRTSMFRFYLETYT